MVTAPLVWMVTSLLGKQLRTQSTLTLVRTLTMWNDILQVVWTIRDSGSLEAIVNTAIYHFSH